MRSAGPIPRALRRPRLAALAPGLVLLAALAGVTVRGADAPTTPGAKAVPATDVVLGTPVPPPAPSDAERGVGLLSLDANGGTVAARRTDGRVLVRTGGTERVCEASADLGEFRVVAVAGDGVPVVVTTRGRLVLLEPGGARLLPLAVQRSAKPAAVPGSRDVVLGSENGSIRRLRRDGDEPRLESVVPSGDEPVGALAASADRVVYARLDGVVLEASLAGGAPRELARPARAVASVHVAGPTAYLLEGDALVVVGASAPVASTGVRAAAVSSDGALVALLLGDVLEVRRLADGAHAATEALAARGPTALAFADDGRTLLVATRTDARPWRIPVETRPAPSR